MDNCGTVRAHGWELDHDDGTGNNFRLERDLVAGTYYIRVAGQTNAINAITGNYSLSVVTTTQAAASGMPTVTATSGTAYNEDVELTAAIGSVADVNGIDSSSLQWQWYSAPAPTSGTPADNDYTAITEATAATFTPDDAQVGMHVRVCVRFDDGQGNAEGGTADAPTLCSTAAIIVNVNDAPTSADNTISMFTSDASYTFKAADFAFMDADSGHTELASITITGTTIPSGASFTNDGNAVTAGTDSDERGYRRSGIHSGIGGHGHGQLCQLHLYGQRWQRIQRPGQHHHHQPGAAHSSDARHRHARHNRHRRAGPDPQCRARHSGRHQRHRQ